MAKWSILISLSILLLLSGIVYAGHITLESRYVFPRVVSGENFSVDVSLKNSGDEAAYEVSLTPLLSDGFSSDNVFVGTLDYNSTFNGRFHINLGDNVPLGGYAFIVRTDYKDANGYPFSSISIPPERLVIGKPSSSLVSGKINGVNLPVDGSKSTVLNVRNLDDREHDVKITLYLPRELDADIGETTLSLNPRDEKEFIFDVSSMGALEGSSYAIYALIEYEEEGMHYSSVATGIVRIVGAEEGFSIPGWAYIAVLSVVVLLFIVYQFAGKRK